MSHSQSYELQLTGGIKGTKKEFYYSETKLFS